MSVAPDYHTSTYQHTPHGRGLHTRGQTRTLSDRHRHMLEVESGISPEMIARRGYWTAFTAADIPEGFDEYQYRSGMFPILVIPQWNTVGRLFAYVLRPDNPRRGKDGKLIKYEAQPGAPVGFDVPPAMVSHLRTPHITLYITEGSKKADAMASRGQVCISLSGVYAFLIKRLVVSELDEFGDGRRVRIVFDRDVMTNPNVADALNRIAGAINRRDGRVELVYLPDTGDGKTGVDDYFAAGGTVADLETLCTPWEPVRRPKNMAEYADPYAEIERLQRLTSAQAQLLRNPHLKDKPRMVGFATITAAAAKKARGEVEPDGRVRLQVSDIVNDYRPKPPKGEAMPDTNPQDGSFPLTRRDNAKATIKHLAEHDALDVVFLPTTRQASDGSTYADSDVFVRIDNAPAAILQLAHYAERKTRKAYTRQGPCPHCGEVHDRSITTSHEIKCHGCGSVHIEEEPTRIVPVPVAQRPEITDEQRANLERRTTAETDRMPEPDPAKPAYQKNREASNGDKVPPSPAPVNYVSQKNWEAPPAAEPDRTAETIPAGLWSPPAVNLCVCGVPIPDGRKWTCSDKCSGPIEVSA